MLYLEEMGRAIEIQPRITPDQARIYNLTGDDLTDLRPRQREMILNCIGDPLQATLDEWRMVMNWVEDGGFLSVTRPTLFEVMEFVQTLRG